MAFHKLVNDYYVNLDGGITNTDTTITVTGATSVIPVPSYATIGTEQIEITNISGQSLTVTRAVNGISAPHNAGDEVSFNIYAQNINELIENKANSEEGKGLSTEDYTTPEKAKLDSIEDNANKYIHPSSHPISLITGLQAELDSKLTQANLPIFGQNHQNWKISTAFSTTSEIWKNYLSCNTTSIPGGTYRIGFTIRFGNTTRRQTAGCQVLLDGQKVMGSYNIESPTKNGAEHKASVSDFDYVTFDSQDVHNLVVQIRAEGGTVSAYGAKVEIWRVE